MFGIFAEYVMMFVRIGNKSILKIRIPYPVILSLLLVCKKVPLIDEFLSKDTNKTINIFLLPCLC